MVMVMVMVTFKMCENVKTNAGNCHDDFMSTIVLCSSYSLPLPLITPFSSSSLPLSLITPFSSSSLPLSLITPFSSSPSPCTGQGCGGCETFGVPGHCGVQGANIIPTTSYAHTLHSHTVTLLHVFASTLRDFSSCISLSYPLFVLVLLAVLSLHLPSHTGQAVGRTRCIRQAAGH
jgi:hypothetical protein